VGLRSRVREAVTSLLRRPEPMVTKTAPSTVPAVAPSAPETADPAHGWVTLGPAGRLVEGRAATFARPGGGAVSVFLHEGRVHAIDDACTHEDGPLGEGAVHGTCVTCPYHDWQYDFTTGTCLTDPTRPLATWEVRVREGQVELGAQRTTGTLSRGGDHNDGMETLIR
jgi:nitrite reductase/ring-hydroxylating ferredoxin subunit